MDRLTLEQRGEVAQMVERTLTFPQEYREVFAAKDREIFEGKAVLSRCTLSVQRKDLTKVFQEEWAESDEE